MKKFRVDADSSNAVRRAGMRYLAMLLVALVLFPGTGLAAGLSLYEQGQPSIGTANAGQAAYAEDASIAYYNPAGMTHLERSELLLGSQLLVYTAKFSSDPRVSNPYRGSDGGNAGMLIPGGGFYYVQKLFNGRAAAGLALNAPAGLGLRFEHGWKGRYLVQEETLAIANINPSIAYKVNDWLSVGAGLSVYYAMLKQEMAVFNPPSVGFPPLTVSPNPDGSMRVTATDWRLGYNLGVLVEPRKGTRVGVAYRSQAEFVMKGKGHADYLGDYLTTRGVDSRPNLAFTMPLPRSITVSGYHEFTPKWAGLADVGWQNWSAFDHMIINGPNNTVNINEDWKDTWRLGLGAHYRPIERLLLKAGFSYDSDPTSLANRLPNLPLNQQWRYATGFDWDFNKNMVISLNYEFVDMGHARIDKDIPPVVVDPPGVIKPREIFPGRQFDGEFDQFINLIGVSFRWKFGKGEPDEEKKKT